MLKNWGKSSTLYWRLAGCFELIATWQLNDVAEGAADYWRLVSQVTTPRPESRHTFICQGHRTRDWRGPPFLALSNDIVSIGESKIIPPWRDQTQHCHPLGTSKCSTLPSSSKVQGPPKWNLEEKGNSKHSWSPVPGPGPSLVFGLGD